MKQNTWFPRPLAYIFISILMAAACFVSGCSSFDNITFGETEEAPRKSPELLINDGMDAYGVGDYAKAIKAFEQILDEYPFSQQAMLAELKAADAKYYNESYLEAKVLYQEFEERHPTNEAIPYVIFQIGMCDFVRTDRLDRDTTGARDAIISFSRLLRTFPDSPYTEEAQARIDVCRDFLVNHEYHVAVFYVRTKKYKQAIHRLKYLTTMYPEAEIAPLAQKLLKRLEDGDPPRWGLSKWLPDNMLPSWQ